MKKFFIDYYRSYGKDLIKEVEVIKETTKQAVIIDGGREYRRNKPGHIFNTYDEAKAAYIAEYKKRVKEAKSRLEYAEEQLQEVISKL